MSFLARRNLIHGRNRFAVALNGIACNLVLAIIKIGLLLSFTTTSSDNIRRFNYEFLNQMHLEAKRPIPGVTIYRHSSTAAIKSHDHIIAFMPPLTHARES
jgi:hypothetical protein